MQILIDPEFKRRLPPPTKEELAILRKKLIEEGCNQELPVWRTSRKYAILVDGHHRREICMEEGIRVKYRCMEFKNRAAVLKWIDEHALGHRNLTDEQKALQRGKDYNEAKEKAPMGHDVPATSKTPNRTRAAVAKAHNVSVRTLARDSHFASAMDILKECNVELYDLVLKGDSGLSKKEVIQRASSYKAGHGQAIGSKRRKSGKIKKFNWPKWTGAVGTAVRLVDEYAKRSNVRESPSHQGLVRKLNEVLTDMRNWYRDVEHDPNPEF